MNGIHLNRIAINAPLARPGLFGEGGPALAWRGVDYG